MRPTSNRTRRPSAICWVRKKRSRRPRLRPGPPRRSQQRRNPRRARKSNLPGPGPQKPMARRAAAALPRSAAPHHAGRRVPRAAGAPARSDGSTMNGTGGTRKWNLRRYLVAGVLVWLPILATVWVVTFMLHLMDLTLKVLPPALRPEALVGFSLPGLGAVFALIVLLLTGLLVTNLIGRRLVIWGEEVLNRIPVVRTVYGGVKSFAESVFSQSNAVRKVVMIEYPRAGVWSIGFLTAEDVPEVSEKLREPHVAVYISSALNATAGYLVIVPRRDVVELDMSVDAAMKMIITCGVVVPPAPNQTSLAKPAA